ncbi:hypothetical protein PT015_10215 [Candidatus Mycobacterium wuenschmannii]|uniref:DUF732 domain-containing protein n=1 Tax=Candidatus Mycobacterium wuenschmannii TaxID=3027808 RepID=A0ABY8W1K4_9MYCO|nr:hypothetical protein [Candidatus Mycobacterium wuenschmannii]WIM89760.1 hypothetical protein PT015_10215 [Candidatus Mycobacterium wuenschmannii]
MTANYKAGLLGRSSKVRKNPGTERTAWDTVEIVATSVVRPVIVTAAVFGAVLGSIPAAHADSAGDAMAPVLNGVGIGNNGPVSGAIAQMGQSICPMLVKPGGSLASGAAQVTGHGGLEAPMAGFLAQMAIQSQCPGWINSVANGNMPFPLPGAGGPGLPIGLPGAPAPGLPLGMPGAPVPRPFPGF